MTDQLPAGGNYPPESLLKAAEAIRNTDVQLWQKFPDDAFSPRIHVTEGGCIGITHHALCIVMSVERWHAIGEMYSHMQKALGDGLQEYRHWKDEDAS